MKQKVEPLSIVAVILFFMVIISLTFTLPIFYFLFLALMITSTISYFRIKKNKEYTTKWPIRVVIIATAVLITFILFGLLIGLGNV